MSSGIYPRTEYHSECISIGQMGNQRVKGKHWKWAEEKLKNHKGMKGKHHSKKTKVKLRKIKIKYLEVCKIKFLNTDIEKIMKIILDYFVYLKIMKEFKHSFKIGKFIVDFYIPQWNLIVECNSKWWHSGFARKYKDMKRRSYLEKRGYKILIFWENELYKFKNLTKIVRGK